LEGEEVASRDSPAGKGGEGGGRGRGRKKSLTSPAGRKKRFRDSIFAKDEKEERK